jgi:hypothetical protein
MLPADTIGNIDSSMRRARTRGSMMAGPEDRQQLLDAWLALASAQDFDGAVVLPMLTGSMAPALPVGARLHIESARRRRFGVGDVVVFVRDEKLTAHRLILCLGFGRDAPYLEKGDWNAGFGLVRRSAIRGVVTAITPPGEAGAATRPLPPSRREAALSLVRAVKALLRGRPKLPGGG